MRDSGKTTLANVISQIVGKENTQAFSMDHINRFTNHAMFGKLLGVCTDLSAKKLKPEAMEWLKEQTGGDQVSAEVKFGSQYTYISKCRYIIASNFRPSLGDDSALENRFLTIPFPESVPLEVQNPNLLSDIMDELQHIFFLVFNELRGFIEDGMRFESIGEWDGYDLLEYSEENKVVSDFYKECCYPKPGNKIGGSELYFYYSSYCEKNGITSLSERKFCVEFKKIAKASGLKEDKNGGKRGYKDLGVMDSFTVV